MIIMFIDKNNPRKLRNSVQIYFSWMILFYKFDVIYIFMKYYDTYLHKDEKYNKYLRTIVQYHK